MGQNYAVAKIGTTWYHARDLTVGGYAYDADFLINPRVSYTLANPTYTYTPTCLNNNQNVAFTLSAPAMYTNKMYNYWAFIDSAYNQFYWIYGDGSAGVSALSNNHTYAVANTYTNKLFFLFDGWCVSSAIDSVKHTISICTEINENSTSNISIYPNPAKNVINIENASNAFIEVYSLNGSLVKQQQLNTDFEKVDLGSLSNGNYILKLNNGNSSLTKKIVVEK